MTSKNTKEQTKQTRKRFIDGEDEKVVAGGERARESCEVGEGD